MNKSVLIATCDFLVLAVLSLNSSDRGDYRSKEARKAAAQPPKVEIAAENILNPADDFRVEPVKIEVADNFENQLLLLAANEEKDQTIKKLTEEAQKDKAEVVKELQEKSQAEKDKLLAQLKLEEEKASKMQSELKTTLTSKKELESALSEKKEEYTVLKAQSEKTEAQLKAEALAKAQLAAELKNTRTSVEKLTATSTKTLADLAKIQKENLLLNKSRDIMKSKALEAMKEKQRLAQELDKAKADQEALANAKSAAEQKIATINEANLKLQGELKLSLYKHEQAVKDKEEVQQAKIVVEEKLEKVNEERVELKTDLAVTKKESQVLNQEVVKLNKRIYGPAPTINRTLFKTSVTIKDEDFVTSTYEASSYSPLININGNCYTLVNFDNMKMRRAIINEQRLIEFSLKQYNEKTKKSYRIPERFYYFKNSPQTLLIPCVKHPEAIKIRTDYQQVTDILPELHIIKHKSGKVLKLDKMFYNRKTKRLAMERGLAEEASANQPELGDLIVDAEGQLIGIFSHKERNFLSASKFTELEAFVFSAKEPLSVVTIKNLKKIPDQLETLYTSIED